VRDGVEIDNYTLNDPLRVKFDGNYTDDFSGTGLFSLVLNQNGSRVNSVGGFWADGNQKLRAYYGGVATNLVGDFELGRLGVGTYGLVVTDANVVGRYPYCTFPFRVSEDGNNEVPAGDESTVVPYQLCSQLTEGSTEWQNCQQCYDQPGIWTAVGCIQTNSNAIVTQILQIAMGIAGGIALIMILAAGFMLSVSQGDPKRVSEARELITSAIIGLLFIVFSVTILQFIGVTLFKIPGLGG
jgi:hypothetical protein